MSNIYTDLWSATQAGQIARANAAQTRSRNLVQLMHVYGSGSLKGMLLLSGLDTGPLRAPQATLSAAQLSSLHADLVKQGFLSS